MSLDLTSNNPDLAGFDLAALQDLGAFKDGSGGGIQQLAWTRQCLRETQERLDRLQAFIRKYQLTLARLCWDAEVSALPPVKNDAVLFVPEIRLAAHSYNKQRAAATEIAALWPTAAWRRSMPRYSTDEDRRRDYTAEIDGVIVRIEGAETCQPVKVDPFAPCGRISILPNQPNPEN